MMNSGCLWGLLAAFVSGVIVGAIAANAMSGREYREALERAEERNDDLSKKLDSLESGKEREVSRLYGQVTSSLRESVKDFKKKSPDFVKLSRKYGDPDFDEHFGDYEHPPEDEELKEPFRITEEDAMLANDRVQMTYYQEDRVLVDEDREPLDDPLEACGQIVWEELAHEREDVVYVQNDVLDAVYIIFVEHGVSYHRDVLGEDMTNTEE